MGTDSSAGEDGSLNVDATETNCSQSDGCAGSGCGGTTPFDCEGETDAICWPPPPHADKSTDNKTKYTKCFPVFIKAWILKLF